MAKIMLGSLAGAISGALGNDVYSHGRHGYYVRRRVIPTKAFNTYTLKVRNILTICSRAWGALSEESQQAWNTWAQSHPITDRLGQKQVLFGAGAYTMLNSRLLLASDTAITLPPAGVAPAPLTTLTAVADASAHTCVLTTAPTPLGANNRLWIEVALVLSQGRKYVENSFKLVAVSAKNQATGLGIGAALELRFGSLIEAEDFVIRGSVFDSTTGLMSGPKDYTGAVVA
jgi:hypothetical protein